MTEDIYDKGILGVAVKVIEKSDASSRQYDRGIIEDRERIGDHGTDISEFTMLMSKNSYSDEIRMIEEMSKEAMVMLFKAVGAFAQADTKRQEHSGMGVFGNHRRITEGLGRMVIWIKGN